MSRRGERVELHAHTNMSMRGGIDATQELLRYAMNTGLAGIAITDDNSVEAYPEAMRFGERYRGIKIIYGMEAYVDLAGGAHKYNVTVLVKKQEGIPVLYKLISEASLQNKPIDYSELCRHRDLFLIGSGTANSLLYTTLFAGVSDEVLERRMQFFDYIEVLPPSTLPYPKCRGMGGPVWEEHEYETLTEKLIRLADKNGKMVVAVSDARCTSKYDLESFYALMWHNGTLMKGDRNPRVYLRGTDEMLDEFLFLGKDKAWEIVVNNTNLIADEIGFVLPIRKERQYTEIENAYEQVEACVYAKTKEMFGDSTPEPVSERVNHELQIIRERGYASYFMLWRLMTQFSREKKCYYYTRGISGSSYVAYALGITDVNPLPEEFGGCNIPFEGMVGLQGEKFPDIDMNFRPGMQPAILEYLKSVFGEHKVVKAGVVGKATGMTANKWMQDYLKDNCVLLTDEEIDYLTKKLIGVKRAKGQHPGGIILIPTETDIYEYTPYSHLAYGKDEKIEITHFDYHELTDVLLKIDVLGSDNSEILSRLWETTGVNPFDIDLQEMEAICKEQNIDYASDELFFKASQTKREVSQTREDFLDMFTKAGMPFDIAYTIVDEVRRGRAHSGKCTEWDTYKELLKKYLKGNKNIIKTLEKTEYLFPRAHEQSRKNAWLRFMYYKQAFPSEYLRIVNEVKSI